MNPWKKYTDMLSQEMQQLGEIPGSAVPHGENLVDTIDALVEGNNKCRKSVDAAMRLWIETRDWSPLSPMERFFVYQRIVHAHDLLVTLQLSPSGLVILGQGTSETDVLSWLLVDLWDTDRAIFWLKVTALHLHGYAPGLYHYHRMTEPPPHTI